MESTYAHLKDSDHIREARKAFDLETEEHESELTPEVCPKCGESPPEDSRLCPWCGLAFTPDTTELDSAEKQTTESAEADDLELAQKIATAMREEPEAFDEILEEIHTEENESAKTN
jgi:hypothetical protein